MTAFVEPHQIELATVEADVHRRLVEIRNGINIEKNKEVIVKQYTPLVHKLAHKCTVQLDHDDLVQNGFMGLIKAIDAFDPTEGTKFITYIHTAILNVIYRESNAQRNMVFIPVNKIDDAVRIQRYINSKISLHGANYKIVPSEYQTVANELGMTMASFTQCMEQLQYGNHTGIGGSMYSIDHTTSDDDGENNALLAELAECGPSLHSCIEQQDMVIKSILDQMHPNEAELLVLWYGLRGEEPHTLDELVPMRLEDRNGNVLSSRSTIQRRCMEVQKRFTDIAKKIGIDSEGLV